MHKNGKQISGCLGTWREEGMHCRRARDAFANLALVQITCSTFSPYTPDIWKCAFILYFLSTLFLYKKIAWMFAFSCIVSFLSSIINDYFTVIETLLYFGWTVHIHPLWMYLFFPLLPRNSIKMMPWRKTALCALEESPSKIIALIFSLTFLVIYLKFHDFQRNRLFSLRNASSLSRWEIWKTRTLSLI